MSNLDNVGADWLADEVDSMAHEIIRIGPIQFNEDNRYLPQGVSPRPGFIRYDLFPFLRELIENFDPFSPVRETNLKKGVQTGYTTLLESIILYYIGHIKTQPLMFLTADDGLASIRIENNIIPMINESGFADNIRSADIGNKRKTGKTKDFMQWDGGGFMIYNGAQSATKMRQTSVPLLLKDELDGWKLAVGKDGNSDTLTDARASTYWDVRKILRGSTPLLKPSMIDEAYERGDQRKYLVLCHSCSFPQELRQEHTTENKGVFAGGFKWDLDSNEVLILESVRYCCCNCGHEHFEHDKERLFSQEHGAHWHPTATPREEFIRSYHLPAWYSPFGFRPWYKGISDFLGSFDPKTKEVISISKFQEYYNNTLGEAFQPLGVSITTQNVSGHRRIGVYKFGEIPNEYAAQHSGSPILFLTCQVDVHKNNLAVSVMGWTRDARCYVIDYWRFERMNEEDDCASLESPVWGQLQELLATKEYTADDGKIYNITMTLIDAGYANATVTSFCSHYRSGVYAILGRDRPGKNAVINEFSEFTTQAGVIGYKIVVDHYKDRLGVVLRRQWHAETGQQPQYHFNAPGDITDAQLKELTVETRREKVDDKGNTVYYWHRPGNARNELFDLTGYGHAAVDMIAWALCIEQFEMKAVDWPKFWDYIEQEKLYFRIE